jgi:orotidine-5'-phosphate decarboxylase
VNFTQKLDKAIERNNSLLCVGLDPVLEKIPTSISNTANLYFQFNKTIIDAVADQVCAFKPNSAFYEWVGASGIEQLKETCDYINENYPHIPIILDAKRGDIGDTNLGYVSYAYDYLGADAITLHPYMGKSSLQPFLDRADKGAIILCQTSNSGAHEFQSLKVGDEKLNHVVAKNVANKWNENKNCLLVVGATFPEEMKEIREIAGNKTTFLVPGIGAQGGDLEATLKAGLNTDKKGLVISASRSIIYSDDPRKSATALKEDINKYRAV